MSGGWGAIVQGTRGGLPARTGSNPTCGAQSDLVSWLQGSTPTGSVAKLLGIRLASIFY